jgi:nucleotide-binding universal stress UspA family protein
MKTILLPFYDDDAAEAALDVSRQLAERFGSYVEGLFVMRPPQIIDGEGIVLADSYLTQLKEEGRRLGDRARARFDDCVARRGMVAGSVEDPSGGVVIGWQEMEGLEGQVIGDHGRVFDLIVIGREFGHPWVDWHVMAEAALFESGRPVVLAPERAGNGLGENVVIAWNNSTETARTVAFAMPLLTRASTVTVVAVQGWGVPGPGADELCGHLVRNGISATTRIIDPGTRSPGEVVLDECADVGADLLVKGAYTQSRLRQLIFGGATRHIMMHATVPVILAH